MKFIDLKEADNFTADKPYRKLLYDSDVTLMILEGEGEFTGAHEMPARAGQLQIMPVTEPHGLKAHTRLRLLVFIAPTL
jgi:hypothetical protein